MSSPEFPRPVRPTLPERPAQMPAFPVTPVAESSVTPEAPIPAAETPVAAVSDEIISEYEGREEESFIGSSALTKSYLEFIDICFKTANTPYLEGLPGVGKTALIEQLVMRDGSLLRTIIGAQIEPSDMLGLPVVKHLPNGTIITEFTKPDWFYETESFALANPDKYAVVFLDEITTSSPPVQAAMLRFIAERRIGKFILPANVYIIAAGNPPAIAANGNQLSPPTANRLAHRFYEPSIPDWLDGMTVGFNSPNLSDNERLQRGFIVSFLTSNTRLINNMPEDPEEASRAWPSMRSWNNGARALGQTTSMVTAKSLLSAFVGDDAANEYFIWLQGLQLPDLNKIFQDPKGFNWRGLDASSLYLTLFNSVNLMTDENAELVLDVFKAAEASRKSDIIYSLHTHLNKKARALFPNNDEHNRALRLEVASMFNKLLKGLR